MKQKIWVIDADGPSDISNGRRPSSTPAFEAKNRRTNIKDETIVLSEQGTTKNPALSFSLSLIMCGAGYLYIGRYRLGAIFASMQIVLVGLVISIFYSWNSIRNFSVEYFSTIPMLVLSALVLIFIVLFLWLGSAVDAYRRTVCEMDDEYAGVDYEYVPVIANVFFPGWGHFLNGQPKRGSVYLLFALVGLFSGIIVLTAWPLWSLIAFSPGRSMFEFVVILALLFVPVGLLAWVVSVYDIFRRRIGESLKSHMPRSSAVLTLLLAISVGLHFMSGQYYVDSLESVRMEMLQNNMTLLPEVTQNVQMVFKKLLELHRN